jgi:hypothetical protein
MKWSNVEYKPQGGETRTYRRFAWKPTVVGQWNIWLESYQITEQYMGTEWVELERSISEVVHQ